MKLNKNKIRNIISILFVVLAIAMFLHDQFAPAAQVGEPLPPESSQAETVVLPEEEAPSLPKEEAPAPEELPPEAEEPAEPTAPAVARDGSYSSMQEVADYIHTYGKLPQNYITKNKARDLGWESSQGNLWDVAPGMSIGGDRFGNYEGLLPEANGRTWTECDIDYEGGHRNAKRIVFSNDGLIFYTDNHYESFTQLY